MYSPIRGKCKHDCTYCYMKRWGTLNPIRLDERDLKLDLGKGETVFVCYTADLFADDIPSEWIEKVLAHLCEYPAQLVQPVMRLRADTYLVTYRTLYKGDMIA